MNGESASMVMAAREGKVQTLSSVLHRSVFAAVAIVEWSGDLP